MSLAYGWPGPCLHAYTISLQGAFTFTMAATPVRVPADGVMDGMHHWGPKVRPHIDHAARGRSYFKLFQRWNESKTRFDR